MHVFQFILESVQFFFRLGCHATLRVQFALVQICCWCFDFKWFGQPISCWLLNFGYFCILYQCLFQFHNEFSPVLYVLIRTLPSSLIFKFFYFFQSFTMRALTGCWRPVSLLLLAALLIENSLANVIRYDGDVNIGENIKYFIFNTSKYTNFNIHIQVLHSNICIIQSHHISHFNLPIALYPKSSRDSRIILWIIRHSFLSANFVIANYNIEIKIKSVIPLSGCLTPCLGILT